MSACFCACVIPVALFAGLRSGVCASSAVFVGIITVGGAGKDGIASLEVEVEARVAFARFGGMVSDMLIYGWTVLYPCLRRVRVALGCFVVYAGDILDRSRWSTKTNTNVRSCGCGRLSRSVHLQLRSPPELQHCYNHHICNTITVPIPRPPQGRFRIRRSTSYLIASTKPDPNRILSSKSSQYRQDGVRSNDDSVCTRTSTSLT